MRISLPAVFRIALAAAIIAWSPRLACAASADAPPVSGMSPAPLADIPAAQPGGASLEAEPGPLDPATVRFSAPRDFMGVIDISKQCLALLDERSAAAPKDRAAKAAEGLEIAVDTLQKMVRGLQSQEGYKEHWRWAPASLTEFVEPNPFEQKFVIDPPLANASAVAIKCERKNATIAFIRVIDARGAVTNIPVNKEITDLHVNPLVRYLHYPAEVSTVIVGFSESMKDRDRLRVGVGVTDLPEFGQEAVYWLRLALQDLKRVDLSQASEHIKQAIMKVYLYRKSRNRT